MCVHRYCWWTKSCTTKDDDYPMIHRALYIPGGAGFCPSTVWRHSITKPANKIAIKSDFQLPPHLRCSGKRVAWEGFWETEIWTQPHALYIYIPSREKITYPTLRKFGKSSTQNAMFGGHVSSLEDMYIYINYKIYIWRQLDPWHFYGIFSQHLLCIPTIQQKNWIIS